MSSALSSMSALPAPIPTRLLDPPSSSGLSGLSFPARQKVSRFAHELLVHTVFMVHRNQCQYRWIRRFISACKPHPVSSCCETMQPPSPFNHQRCFPLLHICEALGKIFHTKVYRPVIDLFTSNSSVNFNRAPPKSGIRSPALTSDALMEPLL